MSAAPSGDIVAIDDLAHDGRGIGRLAGKAVFVAGALPGETVRIRRSRRGARHDEAILVEVLTRSADRVEPPCEAFGRCGGCALQHLAPAAQVKAKERELFSQLARIGRVTLESRLAPLTGPELGYRRRARLGAHYLAREKRAIVGFRGLESNRLERLDACPVLAAPAGGLLAALATLIGTLDARERLPQIELAVTGQATVLVLRVLDALGSDDCERLREFGRRHSVEFWLQPGGPATAAPLDPPGATLAYRLAESDVLIEFAPVDFVQVNAVINERMVGRAIELLAAEPGDAVLDLYCGVGNFTLPLARRAASVLGVEGDAGLIARARSNAARNAIDNARFAVADLGDEFEARSAREPWTRERFDLVLLDPPRAGAIDVLPLIGRGRPRRVVYISCHAGTLARDAAILVHQHEYRLVAAGVMDMFPHTAHFESIAVFERQR